MYTRSTDYLGNSSRSDFNLFFRLFPGSIPSRSRQRSTGGGWQSEIGREIWQTKTMETMEIYWNPPHFIGICHLFGFMESHSWNLVENYNWLRFSEVLGERGAVFPMEIYMKAKLIKFDTKNPWVSRMTRWHSPGLPDGIAQVWSHFGSR